MKLFFTLAIAAALGAVGYVVYSNQENSFAPIPAPKTAANPRSSSMLIDAYQREIKELQMMTVSSTYNFERKSARIRELQQKIAEERAKPQ